ncbi:hypothetical protein Fmac_015288 [Flemingia macrophylla]|uniref:Uncharacterized protein n=1 Tax=Flemingia macrophylla TaxID=520843 RepID=A0ABD1ME56_9FABA
MTTTLVSVLLRSNLEWMNILRLMLQTPIADHHNSREKALDREDDSQLLLRIEACLSLHESRDIRSSNDYHTSVCPSSQQSGVDEDPEAYAANTYSRPPQESRDKAFDREDGYQLQAV